MRVWDQPLYHAYSMKYRILQLPLINAHALISTSLMILGAARTAMIHFLVAMELALTNV